MTATFTEKARANRRAALASLHARTTKGVNVVSMFDEFFQPRVSVFEFHSTRAKAHEVRPARSAPVLVLTNSVNT